MLPAKDPPLGEAGEASSGAGGEISVLQQGGAHLFFGHTGRNDGVWGGIEGVYTVSLGKRMVKLPKRNSRVFFTIHSGSWL